VRPGLARGCAYGLPIAVALWVLLIGLIAAIGRAL